MTEHRGNQKCMHPVLAEREHEMIQAKLRSAMEQHGLDAMIIAKPENILYATGYQQVWGYAPTMPAGLSTAVLAPDGSCHLILSSLETQAAAALTPDAVQVSGFPTWVFIDDGSDPDDRDLPTEVNPFSAMEVAMSIVKDCKADAKIGIELGSLTHGMHEYIMKIAGEASFQDALPAIMQSRMIKTPWEVSMLRRAAQLTERAMHQMASEIEPGMYPADIENRMMVIGRGMDEERLITGQGLAYAFGPYYSLSGTPRHFPLEAGDIVKLDGGFTHLGYIADIARSCAVGGVVHDDSKIVFDALFKGYERGLELIGPGIRLCDLYQEVRRTVEATGVIPSYARGHVGHSIGISPIVEEFPPISADCEVELAPGMVISFELSYFGTHGAPAVGGFNTEDSFAITEDGYDRFTHVPDTLVYNS